MGIVKVIVPLFILAETMMKKQNKTTTTIAMKAKTMKLLEHVSIKCIVVLHKSLDRLKFDENLSESEMKCGHESRLEKSGRKT